MSNETPEAPETPSSQDMLVELGTRVGRSAIAVIDTVCQRGGFRGEELSSIGQLRDQAVQLVQTAESLHSND